MSSLKDLASLIMVPSLYKDGRLDTVKPLGNGILHPDATGNNDGTDGSTPAEGNFTFSRGSNLAATRVDVNGLIEKGRENLILQSNQFDTTWSNNRSYETSGQSDSDGGSNAWWFREDANTGTHILQQNVTPSSGVYTGSIIAKAKERSGVQFLIEAPSSYGYANFDLTDGSVHSSGELGDVTLIDSNSEDLGGGWYRLRITIYSSVSLSWFKCYLLNSSFQTSYAGVDGNGIYLYQAQLEASMVATDYIETGASTAQAGILEDMPRLDYSGGASCPSLLLEPQRTNLMVQSEYFGDYNVKANMSLYKNNNVLSPEGVYNGWYGTRNSNTSGYIYTTNTILSPSTTYTYSVWLKAADLSVCNQVNLQLHPNSFSPNKSSLFSFVDGTATGDGVVEPYPNGWYRVSLTGTTASSIGYFDFGLQPNLNGSANWGGSDGDILFYAYGQQVEQGSYPTSYIPTYGSSVTRSGDTSITSANTLGGLSVGTFFIEMERQGIDTSETGSAISLRDNAGAEELRLHFDAPASQVRWRDGNNSYAQIGNALPVIAGTAFKIIIKSDGTTAKVFGNGVQLGSDYSIVSSFDFQRIYNYQLGYEIKQQLFFPTALTDSECIALTTL